MTLRPRVIIAAAALFAAGVLAGTIGTYLALSPDTFDMRGTVTLDSEWTTGPGDTCIGKMDHEDVREGTQVAVSDGAGATIAIGRLGPGNLKGKLGCEFPVEVTDVPGGHRIYGVAIPGHGDPVQVSEQDASNGAVRLVLAKVQ